MTGVDINPQPSYPFKFIQADALTFPLDGFDVYHASPLCQGFTQMLNWDERHKEKYPDYIGVMRERFLATKKPYVIENVEGLGGAYQSDHAVWLDVWPARRPAPAL